MPKSRSGVIRGEVGISNLYLPNFLERRSTARPIVGLTEGEGRVYVPAAVTHVGRIFIDLTLREPPG
jgi:hypothetical protein